jgi:hypothetical protein
MSLTTHKGYRIATTRLGKFWILNIFEDGKPGAPIPGVPDISGEEAEEAVVQAARDFINELEQNKPWPSGVAATLGKSTSGQG